MQSVFLMFAVVLTILGIKMAMQKNWMAAAGCAAGVAIDLWVAFSQAS